MDATNKVGVIAPKFSDTVHWYYNIRTVQDVIKIVLDSNAFLSRKQLVIRIHDRIANFNEVIAPGDIVQVFQGPFDNTLKGGNNHDSDNGNGSGDPANILTSAFSKIVLSSPETTSSPTGKSDSKNSASCSCKILNAPTMPRSMAQYPDQYRPPHRSFKLADRVAPRFADTDGGDPSNDLRTLNATIRRKRKRRVRKNLFPTLKYNKILLRFHTIDFAEHPIEIYATRHEPLQLHYNIIKRKLLRMGCLAKYDELDFQWPHLRWIPGVSDKVADIVLKHQRGYGCFVRKRRAAAIRVDSDDQVLLEEEEEGQEEGLTPYWDITRVRGRLNTQQSQTRIRRGDDEMTHVSEDEEHGLNHTDGDDEGDDDDGNSTVYSNEDDELKVYNEPNPIDEDLINFDASQHDDNNDDDARSQASSYLSPSTRYWLDDSNFEKADKPGGGIPYSSPYPSFVEHDEWVDRLISFDKEHQDIPGLDLRKLDVVDAVENSKEVS
ncbi:hypothetical protein AA313_de0203204 [Arthrobotrys entomopaga]|nr:hypothetical protein AA313_de0203204 [Arthrobotrys entomopaga]